MNKVIETKHGIKISEELLINYYENLINSLFKLLPIVEGRDMQTKQIIYTHEEASNQFRKYLDNLIIEICGGHELFVENIYFIKLIATLEGMQTIDTHEHSKIRNLVFHCISIVKKMKGVGK